METGNIIIKGERVIIQTVNGKVWLSAHQIADLFEVPVSAICNNIRAIGKSGALDVDLVTKTFDNGNGNRVEKYNIELIIAMSFRLHSAKSDMFRAFIIRRIMETDRIALLRLPLSGVDFN